MKYYKIIILSTALLINSGITYAGEKPQHGHHGSLSEKRIEKMQKQLDLNSDQVTQLKGISERYKNDKKSLSSAKKGMKALHKLDPNASDYETQLQKLADQQAQNSKTRVLYFGHLRADIYKVLTPEQQQKMQKQMKKKMKNKNRNNKDQ